MSNVATSRRADIEKLMEGKYGVEILDDHLILHNVPYVNSAREVVRGKLVAPILYADGETTIPQTHVVHFSGEYPRHKDGSPILAIKHQDDHKEIVTGIFVDHSFSHKPEGGYKSYHGMMKRYATILSGEAEAADPGETERIYQDGQDIEGSKPEEQVFNYRDEASNLAGISAISKKLTQERVAIIGLGGTGSYVLDLLAKTYVKEIHLFDDDEFCIQNAFRAPSAASEAEVNSGQKKVTYYSNLYSKMRKNIIPHDIRIDTSIFNLLEGMEFVFICADSGDVKPRLFEYLESRGISFIDVGIALRIDDGHLTGSARVTVSTPEMRNHVWGREDGFGGAAADDPYSENIQVADLNALNAVFAVIKWKKLRGFYSDTEKEHYSLFKIAGNVLISEDKLGGAQ